MPEPSLSPRPLLVIVRGKPGAGKTTLAHRLAEPDRLGLPLLSRDVIKAGLVATNGVETDRVRAHVVPLAFDLFHRTIELWLRAGVSLIAEEALSRARAEAMLQAHTALADAVILTCETSDQEAARRYIERENANPRKRRDILSATIDQMKRGTYPWRLFDQFDLGVPALQIDTTDGYAPNLDAIVAFCRAARTSPNCEGGVRIATTRSNPKRTREPSSPPYYLP